MLNRKKRIAETPTTLLSASRFCKTLFCARNSGSRRIERNAGLNPALHVIERAETAAAGDRDQTESIDRGATLVLHSLVALRLEIETGGCGVGKTARRVRQTRRQRCAQDHSCRFAPARQRRREAGNPPRSENLFVLLPKTNPRF